MISSEFAISLDPSLSLGMTTGYNSVMKDLEKSGIKIVKLFQSAGFQAFWVGGIVRDKLLKRESDNMDITTDATPDEVENILKKAGIKSKPVGKEFGTVLALPTSPPAPLLGGEGSSNLIIEITTFRAEGFYSDKRHPDQVRFIKDYLQDAKRRDFTINAMYFDPIKKQIFDPTGGMRDLRLKLIRFVGDPRKRIDEDSLRMFRAVRLATQLGFKLEKNTFAAIKTRAKYIQGVSGERVKKELDKILLSDNRAKGLRLLDEIGLLKFIIPELEKLKKVTHKSKRYHLEGNIFDHTLLCLDFLNAENNLELLYAVLFHDIGKLTTGVPKFKKGEHVMSFPGHPEASVKIFEGFASKYKFSNVSKNLIKWLIKSHDDWRYFVDLNEKKSVELLLDDRLPLLMKVWSADSGGNVRRDPDDSNQKRGFQKAVQMINKSKPLKPLIEKFAKGDLVMKFSGLKPGKQLGEKIDEVKVQIVLGKIKSEKDLKKMLKNY